MTQTTKLLAIFGQVLFAWIYSSGTNYCYASKCTANSYLAFILILVAFGALDFYFLKFFPRFKNIPKKIFIPLILLFPVIFYICAIILNALTRKPLSVIIFAILLITLSRGLWMVLAKGLFSKIMTEYLALTSFILLYLAAGFLIANLNFAISSYLKYYSPRNDIYITENLGKKVNFLFYKF